MAPRASGVAAELDGLIALASALNRLPGVSRRNPESWHIARDQIARGIARAVGSIRKDLGIATGEPLSFHTPCIDLGLPAVRLPGRRVIPVERRPAR